MSRDVYMQVMIKAFFTLFIILASSQVQAALSEKYEALMSQSSTLLAEAFTVAELTELKEIFSREVMQKILHGELMNARIENASALLDETRMQQFYNELMAILETSAE